jgi:Uma2 family endonuclease
MSEVQDRLGHVPIERIITLVPPGCATEQDLLDSSITGDRGCELVDGILVEKPMGYRSDLLGMWLGHLILTYLAEHNVGAVSGGQGGVRFRVGLVRMPDVTFTRWDSVDDPDDIEDPDGAFLEYTPDLVVEVFSPGNTRREMEIKLSEYAKAGVSLVWYVDPDRKEVDVYPKGNPRRKKTFGMTGVLDGGDVLPGFTLPVAKIFEKRAPARPKKKPKK